MSRRTAKIRASRAPVVKAAINLPEGMSVEGLLTAIRLAGDAKFGAGVYAYSEHTADGSVVFSIGEERRRYGWTIDADRTVTLSGDGEAVERVTSYEPVSASLSAAITAAKGARKALARVACAGVGLNSENGHQWFVPDTAEGLGSLVKPMGGAKVHVGKIGASYDHRGDDSALGRYLDEGHELGYLSGVEWADGAVTATINFNDDVPDDVIAAFVDSRVGLSLEAAADRRPVVRDGKKYVELINFRHGSDPASVAVVTHPALAGEILRVAASRRSPPMDRNEAIRILASTTATAEQVAEARRVLASTAATAATATAVADPVAAPVAASRDVAEVQAGLLLIRQERAGHAVDVALRASQLPEKLQQVVRRAFNSDIEKGVTPTATAITAEIDSIRAAFAGDAQVSASGVQIGACPADKLELRMDTLFGRNDPAWRKTVIASRFHEGKSLEDRRHAAGLPRREAEGSFLRLFRDATGHEFSDIRGSKSKKVRASIVSTTFDDAWENVLNRRFIGSFENPEFGDWRKLCKVVPLQNFVKQERMIKGGYGNLDAVAEGQNYEAMTTPADQGHGYTPTKRGGTENVTWEAILRDDVGALDVGPALGMAALRTLYEFVTDLYKPSRTDIVMDYDSVALVNASHSNAGTTALSSTELIVAYKAMLKFADISNSKRLLVTPKYVLVPIDLMNTAFDLTKSLVTFPGGSTADYEFIRKMAIEPIVVRHWTDATDWSLVADPMAYPAAEIGFVGGNEEPELWVQDDATFGSMFNADKITHKVRHPYGGTVLRHETIYGEVVT